YLLRTQVRPGVVLQLSNKDAPKLSPDFADRLHHSQQGQQLVITLHSLQENDTDNYVCGEKVKMASDTRLLSASGTMVLVKGTFPQACSDSSWVIYSLAIVVALLFCALVCCTLYRVNIKKYFQKKPPNIVYEDMSYCSRRNTLVRT
ncbi:CD7 protein, partial [Formicarius rufipectus]|nr:CD7 protein [Formicarius rufipectus]